MRRYLSADLGSLVHAEETPSGGVPSWVKDTAGFWSQGLIDDGAFVNAIQYLVEQGIITLSTMQAQNQESAETISALYEHVERLKAYNKKLEEMNEVLEHEIEFLRNTEQCLVDCGVNFAVTSCEATSSYAHVKGIVQNTGKETLRLEYTAYLTDAFSNGVAIDSGMINSLGCACLIRQYSTPDGLAIYWNLHFHTLAVCADQRAACRLL